MPAHIRSRRIYNPATTFPPTIEPGELAINTANRQLTAGDADPAALGALLPILAVRVFDARGIYATGDYVTQGGYLYRCKAVHGPAPFNAANFETIAGVDADAVTLSRYLLLDGGTMIGSLYLRTVDPIANNEAVHKRYVDEQISNVVTGNVSAATISNQPNTPGGNISSTKVQDAINELDSEKVAIAGSTMTGQLVLPTAAAPGQGGQAARRDYVDAVRTDFGTADATLQSNIGKKVAIDGSDAMTGPLTLPATVAGGAYAVRRDYVDSKLVAATAAEYLSNDALAAGKLVSPATAWAAATPVALPAAANVQPDFNAGIDFTWQLNAGGCVLNNPLNAKPGQKGMIYFTIGGAGCNVGSWGAAYKFPLGVKPTFSPNAGAIDVMSYSVQNASFIHCFFGAGMS